MRDKMNMKINTLRLFRGKILLTLSLLIVLSASIYVAPKTYSYYQAFQLERQADLMLAQSNYQDALEKYEESRGKWNDVEINEKIAKAQNLVESEVSYKAGVEAFDNAEYDKAIEEFLDVKSIYREYEKARSLLEEAKEKLREAEKVKSEQVKEQVKGVQTSVNTEQKISSPTDTPTPQPANVIIPTAQPTAKPDNTSKIMAMKNLFQRIAALNAEIINTLQAIEENKNYSGCSREELMKNPNLTPMAIESLISQCKNLHYSLLNKISLAKQEISNIDRQIQDIIATCEGAECNQFYQEFVSGMEAGGYIAR